MNFKVGVDQKFDFCLHIGQDIKAVDHFFKQKLEFEKRNLSVVPFTLSYEVAAGLIEKGQSDVIFIEAIKNPDIDRAVQLTKLLGFNNFNHFIQSEQYFYNYTEDYCRNIFAGLVNSLQEMQNIPVAKFYTTYGADEFDHNIFRVLCRMSKGKIIYLQETNLMGRLTFFANEERFWVVPEKVETHVSDDRDVTDINNYLEEYRERKSILWADPKDLDVKISNFISFSFFNRIIKKLFSSMPNSDRKTFKIISKTFLRILNRYFSLRYYTNFEEIKSAGNFVYFPLHFPLDSQLTLRGKPFINQLAIVEIISKYVPYPYTLVVKEHPHARGYFDYRDIKKMAKIDNVKILHPFVNSHDVIPGAKSIVVINSSVGFESIVLYNKPVITLGKSFFREQGLTIDVNSLYELDEAFRIAETYVVKKEKVIDFLLRMKEHSYLPNIKDEVEFLVKYAKNLCCNKGDN